MTRDAFALGISRKQAWRERTSSVDLLEMWGDMETVYEMWGDMETVYEMWGDMETVYEMWGDMETVYDKVVHRRLEWLGHIARMNDG